MSSKKFILALILITGMLASPLMASALCTIEAKDEAKSHFVVETCTDIGTFSLGNYYKNWEELTYNYPQPWKGTFITINANNKLYSNSPYAKGSVHMDPYVLESPHIIGDSIVTKWRLPEGIIVEQKLEMIPDGSMIKIDIGNPTTQDMKVGVRISLDTKLYGKDGATIFIPGIGFIANEGVYTSEVGSLRLQDSIDDPSVVAMIDFSEKEIKPDRVVIANWKKTYVSGWDYEVDISRQIKSDSAVILYYDPKTLNAGGKIGYGVYYGKIEESCSDGIRNQGEAGVDCGGPCKPCSIGKSCSVNLDCESGYCYNGVCKAASCSDGIKNQGEADVDCGGPCKPCSIGKSCSVNPDCESGYCHDGRCGSAPILRPDMTLILAIIVVALLLVVLVHVRKKKAPVPPKVPEKVPEEVPEEIVPEKVPVPPKVPEKIVPEKVPEKVPVPPKVPEKIVPVKILQGVGKVIASKSNKGNNVTLAVSNKSNQDLRSCVVEDGVPENTEMGDIGGIEGDTLWLEGDIVSDEKESMGLMWRVGDLASGKKKSVDYSINTDTGKLPPIKRIIFLTQELVKAEILRKK